MKDEKRNDEGEQGAGNLKKEGGPDPVWVLGLADYLALSRRNASNAGEPLCTLSLSLSLSNPFHLLRFASTSRSFFSFFLALSLTNVDVVERLHSLSETKED